MNRWKRMCAALAAAALLAGLTACQSGSVTDNANTYVQGLLDASYLGEISTDYLKVTEYAGREAAEADYESYMAQEAEDLLSYLIVSKPTQAVTQRAQEVIRAIYSHAQYTVAPAEELENGDVTVDVTISPMEFPSPMRSFWRFGISSIRPPASAATTPPASPTRSTRPSMRSTPTLCWTASRPSSPSSSTERALPSPSIWRTRAATTPWRRPGFRRWTWSCWTTPASSPDGSLFRPLSLPALEFLFLSWAENLTFLPRIYTILGTSFPISFTLQ